MRPSVLCFVLLLGCHEDSENSTHSLEEGGYPSDCCKIEGDELGIEKIVVHLNERTVRVRDWVEKTNAPGEYVGFTLDLAGGSTVQYVVKASTEKYSGTNLKWEHPNGADGGASSPAITLLDFCLNCPGGKCDPIPPPSPPCDNPDGCGGGGSGSPDPGPLY